MDLPKRYFRYKDQFISVLRVKTVGKMGNFYEDDWVKMFVASNTWE